MAQNFWPKYSPVILAVIILLAAVLRFISLDKLPPELFGDELDVGYQAYSILKTGKDYTGHQWPVYFQSFSEARAPLFLYSAVPFVGLFGLNEIGIRSAAAFWGLAGVILIYFVVLKLFPTRHLLALSAAFLLTISSWHLHYSRAAFEVTLLLFLLLLGLWFFIKGLEKSVWFVGAAFCWALTVYTYSTANVFLPLFVAITVYCFWPSVKKSARQANFWLAVAIFALALIPIVQQLFAKGSERFAAINISTDRSIQLNINLKRQEDNFDQSSTLYHNKLLSLSYVTFKNYLTSLSPQFLFVEGDPRMRHHVGQMGQLYWFELPLLLIGLVSLANGSQAKTARNFVILWLVAAPLPAALTHEGGHHATRLFILLPPLVIITALGLERIVQLAKGRKIYQFAFAGLVIFAFVNVWLFSHRLIAHYPKESWRWWQVGYKEVFDYINAHGHQYQKIVINNSYEPALVRFLVYTKYDPLLFHRQFILDQAVSNVLPGIDGFAVGKFYFGSISPQGKQQGYGGVLTEDMLYVASQREEVPGDGDWTKQAPDGVVVLKKITNDYQEPIFYLVTKKT